jgi:hypothetical protein
MTEPTRAAVDHHTDLSDPQSVRRRHRLVEHGVDDLHLQEVVARSQTADLAQPPQDGPLAHLPKIGVGNRAAILAAVEVTGDPVSLLDRVPRAAEKDLFELVASGELPDTTRASPPGSRPTEPVHQSLEDRLELGSV